MKVYGGNVNKRILNKGLTNESVRTIRPNCVNISILEYESNFTHIYIQTTCNFM